MPTVWLIKLGKTRVIAPHNPTTQPPVLNKQTLPKIIVKGIIFFVIIAVILLATSIYLVPKIILKGFFTTTFPYPIIQIGSGLSVVAIFIEEYLRKKSDNFSFPILLVALSLYLPLGYLMAFLIGNLVSFVMGKKWRSLDTTQADNDMYASALIAAEGILGALLTFPFAYYHVTDILALKLEFLRPYETALVVILFIILSIFLYRIAHLKTSEAKV